MPRETGIDEFFKPEDAGCWNCVVERQHPARGDFLSTSLFNFVPTRIAVGGIFEFDSPTSTFPARRGLTTRTSTHPAVFRELLNTFTTGTVWHPSSHARDQRRLSCGFDLPPSSRGRSLPHRISNTSSTRSRDARRAEHGSITPRPARLDRLHRFPSYRQYRRCPPTKTRFERLDDPTAEE